MKDFVQFCAEEISHKGLKHVAAHFGYRQSKEHPDTYHNAGGGVIKHDGAKIHHDHSRSGQTIHHSLNDLQKHLTTVHQTKMDLGYDAGEPPKQKAPSKPKKERRAPVKHQQTAFEF